MRRVAARVARRGSLLSVRYVVEGDLARLARAGGRPLWQHTCLELFIGRRGARAYREFNFSPSGEWAAYAFEGYRRAASRAVLKPRLRMRPSRRKLQVEVRVPVPGRLRIGLSAVIEEADGTLSYWALRHPRGKPDFHHRSAFALELK